MTDAEKKLLQARHRLEEAQARDRVKERKTRTRRLIQEGAILEKVLPEVRTIELSELEGYLSRKLGKQISISDRRSPGNRGPPSFFSCKGALTHHPKGQWYLPLASRALCEADAAAAAASRQCHNTCGCCCHRLRRSQLFPFWKQLAPCLRKPATGSFPAEMDSALALSIFSFSKEKQKE